MDQRNSKSKKLAYIEKLYCQENETLQKIRSSIDSDKTHIAISPIEGKIIYTLLQMIDAKYVLEIGTMVGYSTYWIAQGISYEGKVYTIEKSLSNCEKAKINTRDSADNIVFINSDALVAIDQLSKENILFDAVFIDGQKSQYDSYLIKVLPMLRKRALIIADNTMLFDTIYQYDNIDEIDNVSLQSMWHSMNNFNRIIADQSKFTSIILPTLDGLTVAIKL